MSSKAQGLSLNTIVIAAIVLIVLLLLIGMTTGYLGGWKKKFGVLADTSCTGQGGHDAVRPCPSGEREIGATDLPAGRVCCTSEDGRKRCEEISTTFPDGRTFTGRCQTGITSCTYPEARDGQWSCGSGTTCCF